MVGFGHIECIFGNYLSVNRSVSRHLWLSFHGKDFNRFLIKYGTNESEKLTVDSLQSFVENRRLRWK